VARAASAPVTGPPDGEPACAACDIVSLRLQRRPGMPARRGGFPAA
jgi:hypothetical protein